MKSRRSTRRQTRRHVKRSRQGKTKPSYHRKKRIWSRRARSSVTAEDRKDVAYRGRARWVAAGMPGPPRRPAAAPSNEELQHRADAGDDVVDDDNAERPLPGVKMEAKDRAEQGQQEREQQEGGKDAAESRVQAVHRGRDVSALRYSGWNPHLAALENNIKELRKMPIIELSATNDDGDAPAHWAAYSGSLETIEFLHDNAPETLWAENVEADTPADFAAAELKQIVLRLKEAEDSGNTAAAAAARQEESRYRDVVEYIHKARLRAHSEQVRAAQQAAEEGRERGRLIARRAERRKLTRVKTGSAERPHVPNLNLKSLATMKQKEEEGRKTDEQQAQVHYQRMEEIMGKSQF